MSQYTNLMMGAICKTVERVPLLKCSKTLSAASHSYIEDQECIIKMDNEDLNAIVHYSLIDPTLKWRADGIHSLYPISSVGVNTVKRWVKEKNDFEHRNRKASISDSGWMNIGYFDIGKRQKKFIFMDGVIPFESSLLFRCEVILIMLHGGQAYLSIHWLLKETATALLRDINVSDLPLRSVQYRSCNPFSQRFLESSWQTRRDGANKRLMKNMVRLRDDLNGAERLLFRNLGLPPCQESVHMLSIHLEGTDPNVTEAPPETPESRHNGFWIHPSYEFWSIYRSQNKRQTLRIIDNPSKSSTWAIPYLCIYTQNQSELDTLANLSARINPDNEVQYINDVINDMYLFQALTLIELQYKKLDSRFSRYIIDGYKQAAETHYRKVFEAYRDILSIEDTLLSIQDNIQRKAKSKNAPRHIKVINNRTNNYLASIRKLKERIEVQKQTSNEHVQAENLTYQRNMAILVAMLAGLQIAIALISMKEPTFCEWVVLNLPDFFTKHN